MIDITWLLTSTKQSSKRKFLPILLLCCSVWIFCFQRDFEVRELRDLNKNVTRQIGDSVAQNPDIAHTVHLYFSQANLSPPPAQGSSASHSLPKQLIAAKILVQMAQILCKYKTKHI